MSTCLIKGGDAPKGGIDALKEGGGLWENTLTGAQRHRNCRLREGGLAKKAELFGFEGRIYF